MDIRTVINRLPSVAKFILNFYSPFRGAGIEVEKMHLDEGFIRVKMPLTRKNRNIVGVHFGGSLYAMVDPFYMLILMHQLGEKYIVWDKAATIQFLSPGRGTVYADVRINPDELTEIRQLALNHEPVFRTYHLDIIDEQGQRIAAVEKVVYIRRKKPKGTRSLFRSKQ